MAALWRRWRRSSASAKIFRPYRDVRFAKDKTPYKTHQGAFVAAGAGDRLVRRGLRRAASAPAPASTRRAPSGWPRSATRSPTTAPAPSSSGSSPRSRRTAGEIGGDRLKTTPRGYDADHPRIELLRHKSLIAGRSLGFEPVIHTPELLDLVRDDWRALRPLVEWVADARRLSAERQRLAVGAPSSRSGSQ